MRVCFEEYSIHRRLGGSGFFLFFLYSYSMLLTCFFMHTHMCIGVHYNIEESLYTHVYMYT